jgi:hypothetical protein
LLSRTNSEIQAIIEAYRRSKYILCFQSIYILIYLVVYNKDLEKEINSRVGGTDFRRLFISAIQVKRFIHSRFLVVASTFKANRDELSPQQIQQACQMGIESIIDR